jgi:hypothetical protein
MNPGPLLSDLTYPPLTPSFVAELGSNPTGLSPPSQNGLLQDQKMLHGPFAQSNHQNVNS